eukprot:m.55872 g.55872  ORF g.55872 m.55872 type:complete len:70 (+) comp9277_c0_seq1:3238-3447(+)
MLDQRSKRHLEGAPPEIGGYVDSESETDDSVEIVYEFDDSDTDEYEYDMVLPQSVLDEEAAVDAQRTQM